MRSGGVDDVGSSRKDAQLQAGPICMRATLSACPCSAQLLAVCLTSTAACSGGSRGWMRDPPPVPCSQDQLGAPALRLSPLVSSSQIAVRFGVLWGRSLISQQPFGS